ncbi:hypothetical protein AWB77_06307 [Caballeronia fortuita]|uniref:Lipoprotein n=1 Tax=Caballeronia fortuita TaxID=1777138 RepID=A0A158E2Y7_9BURK|nr:hypothetical protein [Caballeronia fortuita]SAL01251.1 hypothetical protein AWB77_06307 [Caballeronia fortuita]
MQRFIGGLLVAVALGGCGSTMSPLKDADKVPTERLFSADKTTPGEGKQKITVVRNGGTMIGSGMHLLLKVDGEKTAELGTNDAVELYLAKGEHLLMVEPKYMSTSSSQLSAALVVPTKFPVYRIDINLSGPKFQPSVD